MHAHGQESHGRTTTTGPDKKKKKKGWMADRVRDSRREHPLGQPKAYRPMNK
jgi:hypothetical protein